MANPEHLAKLREGVEPWNEWREQDSKLKPDPGGADLGLAKLFEADLLGANLMGAYLCGANLSRADLAEPTSAASF